MKLQVTLDLLEDLAPFEKRQVLRAALALLGLDWNDQNAPLYMLDKPRA